MWRGQRHGWLLALFAVATQVITVDVNGLQFALQWPLNLGLSVIWAGGADWDLSIQSRFGLIYDFAFSSARPTHSIGINIPPALMVLYLLLPSSKALRGYGATLTRRP